MENPTHDDMMLITVMDLSDDIGDKTDSKEVEKMEEAAKALPAPELELPGEEEPENTAEQAEENTPEEPEKTAEDQ